MSDKPDNAVNAEVTWDDAKVRELGNWYVSEGMLPASFADNDYILLWWIPEYDDLLRQVVDDCAWAWHWVFNRRLKDIVPEAVLAAWRSTDPLCVETPWYRVLGNFIKGRATQLGVRPRAPRRVKCACCSRVFWEWETDLAYVNVNEIDICGTCFGQALYPQGSSTATREAVTAVLQRLSAALGRPPKRGDLSGRLDFKALTTDARSSVIQALRVKPRTSRVEELFGSWEAALTHASTAPATPLPQYQPPVPVPAPAADTEFTSTDPGRYRSAMGNVPDISVDLRLGDWEHEAEIEAEIRTLMGTGYLALAEAALTAIARSGEPADFKYLRAELFSQTARLDEARATGGFYDSPQLQPRDLRTITRGPYFYEALESPPRGNARFILIGGPMEYVDLRGEHECIAGEQPTDGPPLKLSENVAQVNAMAESSVWVQAAVSTGHAIMSSLTRAGANPRPYGRLVSRVTRQYRDAVKAVCGSLPKAAADVWCFGEVNKSRWAYQDDARPFVFNARADYSLIALDMPPAVSVWGWPDRSDLCLQAFIDTISIGAPEPVTVILPDVPAFRDFARRYVRGTRMTNIERTLMEECLYGQGFSRRGYVLAAEFEPSLVVYPDGTEDDGRALSSALAYLDANHTLRLSVWSVLGDALLREVATSTRVTSTSFSMPAQDRFDKVRWYAQQARFEPVAALFSPYRPTLLDANRA
jgi:hypothetical protein